MINNIERIMYEIVVQKNSPGIKSELQKEIADSCNVAYGSIYRWLKNYNQPSYSKLSIVHEILRKHKPDLKIDDLLSQEPNSIKEKFKLTK